MVVAGTAAAVGVALKNTRRLTPAFVDASAPPRETLALAGGGAIEAPATAPWETLLNRILTATLLAAAGIISIALIASTLTIVDTTTTAASTQYGPPVSARAASDAARGYEGAYAASAAPAAQIGGMIAAAAQEQHAWDVVRAMVTIEKERAATGGRTSAFNAPQSLNGASGFPVGTVLRARITVYGCTGAGGGFCGNMATGIRVFEGAAACSYDLPFGTKIKIQGDPTGRVYECLDRGALANTWVDVFFNDTAEGIHWASLLGGTVTEIEIVN